MSERDIFQLENQFPAVSAEVFAAAGRRVLASGQSVLQSEGECLFRVHPDGRRELVKKIEPPVRVKPGTVYRIG